MSEDLSAAELYAIEVENTEPSYFAQIPAVLYHCTYKDGETTRKLHPISIALYGALKQLGGQNGACWASRERLAEMVGCSTGSISMAWMELAKPMDQLGGKSLITVQKRKKKRKSGGGSTYNHALINNVWGENRAYMKVLEISRAASAAVDKSTSPSPHDGESFSPSPHDGEPLGSPSPHDANNRIQRKKHSVAETEAAAAPPSVCYSAPPFSVSSAKPHSAEGVTYMLRNFWGADENFIREMLRRFDPWRIAEACRYAAKQVKRKSIRNKVGYLREAIENGRVWE